MCFSSGTAIYRYLQEAWGHISNMHFEFLFSISVQYLFLQWLMESLEIDAKFSFTLWLMPTLQNTPKSMFSSTRRSTLLFCFVLFPFYFGIIIDSQNLEKKCMNRFLVLFIQSPHIVISCICIFKPETDFGTIRV